MYQNKESAVKANIQLEQYTKDIDSSLHLFEGNTIQGAKIGHVAGAPIPAGVTAQVSIRGIPYMLGTDSKGNVFINGRFSDGKQVSRRGANAIAKGNAPCGISSKYGCTRRQRYAEELYFDAPSSLVTVASVMQSRNYSCSKYGCNPTSSWATSKVNNINKEHLNLDDILIANDEPSKIKFK